MCNKVDNDCRDEKMGCEGCAYCEKSADEMFEELGFRKNEDPLELGGEMIPYINYRDDICYKTVHFNLKRKTINVSCVNENYEKVLQAINKKVEELGWN